MTRLVFEYKKNSNYDKLMAEMKLESIEVKAWESLEEYIKRFIFRKSVMIIKLHI